MTIKKCRYLVLTGAAVLLTGMMCMSGFAKTLKGTGTVKGNNVNVRSAAAITSNQVIRLLQNDTVTVTGSKKDSDGATWYKVSFVKNSQSYKGYIRQDLLTYQADATASETADTSSTGSDGIPVLTAPVGIISTDEERGEEEDEDDTDSSDSESTQTSADSAAKTQTGTVNASSVNVRNKAVSGAVVCKLEKGTAVTIQKTQKSSDGNNWYSISFTYNDKTQKGWIRSDFVTVNSTAPDSAAVSTDADFESYLTTQGFPDSYKDSLRKLHATYPNWMFQAVQTGLNWSDVVLQESKVGLNLVSKTAQSSYKSTEKSAYNWKKDSWYTFDGGSWAAASSALIQYYMDPRNFLNDSGIFQFESLKYESYQNADGVKKLLASSFMKGNYKEPDGTKKSYAETFVEAGKAVSVSPYHLAARCYQEQGSGTSGSVSGTVSGYENIFNYYNIGAYASNGNSPVTQGLIYAKGYSKTESLNYSRPWNTRYQSILGGAQYVSERFVKKGQNTLYFQKFNVVNKENGLYKHQYMANIQAAASEAAKMKKAYTDLNTELKFYIPVYQQMPDQICEKPSSAANPNNYLASLSVDGCDMIPVFDGDTENYGITVGKKVKEVTILAAPVAASSTVSGTGTFQVVKGVNTFQIYCTSQSGSQKVYSITITKTK